MPMDSMAQGAANHGGENIFMEKQSTIRHLLARGTVTDQIEEGICLALVLTWLANASPATRVINGTAAVVNAIFNQGSLVQTWKADYSTVSTAGQQKLATSQFWFSYQARPFAAGKNIDQDILTNQHAVGNVARFILCLQTSDHQYAHALGIRKMANNTDVYFYDPNYGAVLLPTIATFHTFLADFIQSLYAACDEWYITGFLN
ncbi:YopT-type cysteine protease domain-containing protein [Paraburkholderia sp. EG285A]|uniref:YopT-type cysteine protease domain-containing protein n=1 Tax=Paraburkholderia sp. EG285A TaxID=3237009 RepID=UPI0034D186D7